MSRRLSTITADEIRKASTAWGAHFGDRDPAALALHGLLEIAGGCRTGYTVKCLLQSLKLIGWKSGRTLTKKGKDVLLDLTRDIDVVRALERTP